MGNTVPRKPEDLNENSGAGDGVLVKETPAPPKQYSYLHYSWWPTRTREQHPIAKSTHALPVGWREIKLEL